MKEIFKDIPGYEGSYQVSNKGRVKSLSRKIWRGKFWFKSKDKILNGCINDAGYIAVGLSLNKVSKKIYIHQLVAITFLNYKPDGTRELCVDHRNNISIENKLENLQIITSRENSSKDKKGYTSKYIGVHWCTSIKKYKSQIVFNKKDIHIGCFDDELEASRYYQNAVKAIENGEEIVLKRRKFTSKYKGVHLYKPSKKWKSYYRINGEQKYLGTFDTELEASNAYQNKLKQLNKI